MKLTGGQKAAKDMQARLRARVPAKPPLTGLAQLDDAGQVKRDVRQFLASRQLGAPTIGRARSSFLERGGVQHPKINLAHSPYCVC